ncbi:MULTISPECIES: UDP-N-acetylmuramoyl-L-alanyl-D-glutamate--2,6-diaminopimelate ligase [Nitrospirillum]|uniref:UDP-N-acetylmuramoyl-L-alanyl-D-glutamate--2,6-diaminopimelate ligase n=1 Tax=Nitrospirillum amazonense TaxID=28077 RepID=A0A560FZL3_9PROT|nr:UDP-N-acetylmuramoyl-L-alanyl-D-glutamate--2,6-diaminopimelate ligase [Nitrospirillum amazonense]MEC4591190.1 UDP-N-acetylmuramoyl-L-alanyl-D-glutamate--2,6-diaminopimelate ligase [Nitrospirillum amazonense]TWB27001.1 UDP-N-acetylmuramoylalanyl-D-glutamate--2,6-diaminopimelate ligase [Nitrospirillum amazonense]
MRLTDLMASRTEIAVSALALERDPEITGLTADSRAVKPGMLFAAMPGSARDGRDFIPQAVAAGAVAVLAPKGTKLPEDLPHPVSLIEDANPRRRFALLAAAFYKRQPATIAAVTGTNGKTSTAQFTRQLWSLQGHQAGAMGTLGLIAPGFPREDSLTTPDPVALHSTLSRLAEGGITHLAMEASSHGLDQFRLDGVLVTVGGFTNLTRDHLDYHGTMEAYFKAKAMLFDRVMPRGATAVVNADIPEFQALADLARARKQTLIGFGEQGRELAVKALRPLPQGQALTLEVMGTRHDIVLPLVGRFQVWNALCALGMVIGSGAEPQAAAGLLSQLDGVRGRLELVATLDNGAAVYVDYAHTPDGLETVLNSVRPHAEGRLSVVFGCGGDRDRGKRPMMGSIAARLADRVIVTDDNPRTEIPGAIRAEVLAGCPGATEVDDRAAAIALAIGELKAGDVLVIAGKGHEQGQIVGKEVRPFDDAAVARGVLGLSGGMSPGGAA